jgi:hypothetical protein
MRTKLITAAVLLFSLVTAAQTVTSGTFKAGTIKTPTFSTPPVSGTLTANPSSITSGQSSSLSWNCTNASSASISPTVGAVTTTPVSVSPTATTTYTLTCVGAGGQATSQVTVTVTGSGGTADADFLSRCAFAQAHNGRCNGVDTQLNQILSSPSSGALDFPDGYYNLGAFTNGSQVVDNTTYKSGGGSMLLVSPYNSGGTIGSASNQISQNNFGAGYFNFSPSGRTPYPVMSSDYNGNAVTGIHDFYFQWRIRVNRDYVLANINHHGTSGNEAGRKINILTNNPRVVDALDWWLPKSCDDAQRVLQDGLSGTAGNNGIFRLYAGCGPYEPMTLPGTGGLTLYQTGRGCTDAGAGRNTSNAITAFSRTGGVATFTAQSSLGTVTPGSTVVYLDHLGLASYTSGTVTPLDGVYVVQSNPSGTTYTATRQYETVAPEDVSGFTPPAAARVGVMSVAHSFTDTGKCIQIKPNDWMTVQIGIHLGRDCNGASGVCPGTTYAKDNNIDVWWAFDGEPSMYMTGITTSETTSNQIMQALARTSASQSGGARMTSPPAPAPGGSFTDSRAAGSTDTNWFLTAPGGPYHSGYGQMELLFYESERCASHNMAAAGYGVQSLSRSDNGDGTCTTTITMAADQVTGGGHECWNTGTYATLSNTTLDSGSFNTNYTFTNATGTGTRVLTAVNSCPTTHVVPTQVPGGTPDLYVPAYDMNCNGGHCNPKVWNDEILMASNRIPDPGHGDGTNNYPDPPDHMAISGNSGVVTGTFTCNDASGLTTYEIRRFTGTLSQAEMAQSWTAVTTTIGCAQTTTQSWTDSSALVGTSYCYVSYAKNATGYSTRSNAVCTTVQANNFAGFKPGRGWQFLGTKNTSNPAGQQYSTSFSYARVPSSALAGSATAVGDTTSATQYGICPKNDFDAGSIPSPGVTYKYRDQCKGVIRSQSGGAADTRRNKLYYWGGGHNDYAGDEVYMADFNLNPVAIYRISDPHFPHGQNDANRQNPSACYDGVPAVTSGTPWTSCVPDANGLGCWPSQKHSASGVIFYRHPSDPTQDQMLGIGGSIACGGGATSHAIWSKNLNTVTDTWRWMDKVTSNAQVPVYSNTGGFITNFEVYCDQDPLSSVVFCTDSSQGFFNYDPQLNASKGFSNKSLIAQQNNVVAWHNSAATQSYLFGMGNCSGSPISAINRAGGTVRVTTSYSAMWIGPTPVVGTSKVWVQGTSDSTFWTGNPPPKLVSISGNQLTYATSDQSTASSSGGWVTSCNYNNNGVDTYSGIGAVNIFSVNSPGTWSSWNDNTFDAKNNLDTGNPALGNTCLEFMRGGQTPMNGIDTIPSDPSHSGHVNGGKTPGLAFDPVTYTVVGWPNAGSSVYVITPDLTFSGAGGTGRLTCKRIDDLPSLNNSPTDDYPAYSTSINYKDIPYSTWGSYRGHMDYFPLLDKFIVTQGPDQPIRAFSLR